MGGRHHWWGVRYRTTGRPFTINRGVCSCARVFVLCCICVVCLCRVFVSRLFVCLFVLCCVFCVFCVFCVLFVVPQSCGILCCWLFFCHIKSPISRVRASRVFWPYSDYGQPAPYSIIPQSCGILCCWLFFCHIKSPISRVRASRVFWPYSDYGQPAPYSIIPQSCGILCCWFFLPYQTPYLAEYGPSCVVGR